MFSDCIAEMVGLNCCDMFHPILTSLGGCCTLRLNEQLKFVAQESERAGGFSFYVDLLSPTSAGNDKLLGFSVFVSDSYITPQYIDFHSGIMVSPSYAATLALSLEMMPILHRLREINYLPQKDLEEYLQPLDDLVASCSLLLMSPDIYDMDCDFSHVVSVRSGTRMLDRNVCYTVFSLIGKPDEEPQQVLTAGMMQFVFDAKPKEYHSSIMDVSVQIGFHDARDLSNPYVYGFRMMETVGYTYILKKVVKKLLPPPYETNCMDYLELWKARGGNGPLNEIDCVQECLLKASLNVLNCVTGILRYPSNEAYCPFAPVDSRMLNISNECSKDCKPACLQTNYVVSKEETAYGTATCGRMSTRGRMSMMASLENMETTTYIYKPQYEQIETFSYLGGYVGMWLGISLVAVFDFVETLVMLMRYPFSKLAVLRRGSRIKPRKVKRMLAY